MSRAGAKATSYEQDALHWKSLREGTENYAVYLERYDKRDIFQPSYTTGVHLLRKTFFLVKKIPISKLKLYDLIFVEYDLCSFERTSKNSYTMAVRSPPRIRITNNQSVIPLRLRRRERSSQNSAVKARAPAQGREAREN